MDGSTGSTGSSDLPAPPPLRPRSVGEILEAAFELYGKYWKQLIAIVAIVVIPLTLIQYFIGDIVSNSVSTTSGSDVVVSDRGGVFAAAVLGLLSILIQQIMIGAIAWAVATTLVGREPDVSECYRYGYRHLWSILLVGILFALAVFAGLIAFVIPGIIIGVRLSVSIPALVVEGKRGTEALGRSWNLVRGYSWSVFGCFIVVFLLTGIVNGLFTAIGGDNWFAQGVLAALGSCITTPYVGLVIGLVYFDLRVRKEQLDVPTLDRELQAASAS